MPRTPKVKILRDNIRALGWHITTFTFPYNHYNYYVLFEDSKALGIKEQLAIAVITFIDAADENRRLEVMANTEGFNGKSAKEIMDYFHVNDNPGAKGFFRVFYEGFNGAMPEEYRPPASDHIRDEAVAQLSRRDGDDPNAIYCYDARHNGTINGRQKHRTRFNSDKTKLLREPLYNLIGADDDTISFFYSTDRNDCCGDLEILEKLRRRDSALLK